MLPRVAMRRALILPAAIVVLAGPFVAGYVLSRPDKATTPVVLPSLADEEFTPIADIEYGAHTLLLAALDLAGRA